MAARRAVSLTSCRIEQRGGSRVTWTEEGGLLFRSSESWTKGGRRQGSEGPLLDAASCGWMIWLWCRVLAVSPASWRLRER